MTSALIHSSEIDLRVAVEGSGASVERSTLVQFLNDAHHFFDDYISVKNCRAMFTPIESIFISRLFQKPLVFHLGRSSCFGRLLIKCMQFISTSKKLISRKIKSARALGSQK